MLEFTNLLEDPNGDIRFMLDNSVFYRGVSESIEIVGWVIHRKQQINKVILTSGTETLASANLDIHRPLVSRHFSDYCNSESAGFKLQYSGFHKSKGDFFLKIVMKSGKTFQIAKSKLLEHRSKLLFMHIPKAAGSSVNNFFSNHYANNQYAVHIESNKKWQTAPADLKKLDFLSGHVNLPTLSKKLNLDDYFKVTVVREPFAQLRSHLAWIKRLSMPGEEQRLKNHTTVIQEFAIKLGKIDFSNLDALENLVNSLQGIELQLVDNCQIRYFIAVPPGQTVNEVHAREAIKASALFDKIGTTESIEQFFKEVATKMSWPQKAQLPRENVAQDYYGLDVTNQETRNILAPLVQHDNSLYTFIKG